MCLYYWFARSIVYNEIGLLLALIIYLAKLRDLMQDKFNYTNIFRSIELAKPLLTSFYEPMAVVFILFCYCSKYNFIHFIFLHFEY